MNNSKQMELINIIKQAYRPAKQELHLCTGNFKQKLCTDIGEMRFLNVAGHTFSC